MPIWRARIETRGFDKPTASATSASPPRGMFPSGNRRANSVATSDRLPRGPGLDIVPPARTGAWFAVRSAGGYKEAIAPSSPRPRYRAGNGLRPRLSRRPANANQRLNSMSSSDSKPNLAPNSRASGRLREKPAMPGVLRGGRATRRWPGPRSGGFVPRAARTARGVILPGSCPGSP